ncbi:MarR family winged helix-turn-helix transcriptional regulator [Saccharomonospora glauca]|uniref:Transcriptional regulator n=1 Tax=Saccharomonospora glauca K62 TaxID=928724 RepID=I1D6L6_9PSEU|nr:MarR family transcriptional regulator [Saccharomonospora glauca]EIF00591.1 transcriptional regulator [Saccharomonospora glauca K62]
MAGGKKADDGDVDAIARVGRELGQATVLFHTRLAERLGLSATDHKCLDLAMQADKPLTAGALAELSGLTTGAVTAVIDRLERAGYARRVRSETDRRKVYIELPEDRLEEVNAITRSLGESAGKVLRKYSPEDRKKILECLRELTEVLRSHTVDSDER